MGNELNMKINALPAFTFNWLRMNGAGLSEVRADQAQKIREEVPAEVRAEDVAEPLYRGIQTGSGSDMDALVASAGVAMRNYTVPAGKKITGDAVRLSFEYGDQGEEFDIRPKAKNTLAGKVNSIGLTLEENSEMTVVMDYHSEETASGLAGVQTKISAGKNSLLHLVQIVRPGSGYTFLNDVGGKCENGARIEVIHLVLGGKNTYQGCRIALSGAQSSLDIQTGYLVQKNGHLDMNYDAVHTGKKTTCDIYANGVLRDNAFKLFRGTIDLQNGCSGAVGNEMEDVLLMDEDVENKTIPLILCAEEDVVGNHGATIGRLDESLMFYMESRGMNREEIYEMMAKARIDAIIAKIGDEKTREMLEDHSEEEA